jgi:hypothetical protein
MYDLLLHIETCIGQGQAMAEGYDEADMEIGLSIAEACKDMHEFIVHLSGCHNIDIWLHRVHKKDPSI